MKTRRLQKSFMLLISLLLFGVFSAHSASLKLARDENINLKYPAIIESLYKTQPDATFWSEPLLRNELEKQLSIIVTADVSDYLSYQYRALKQAAEQQNWQAYEYLASNALIFYLSYNEKIHKKGLQWLFGSRIEDDLIPASMKTLNGFFDAHSNQARLQYLQGLLPQSAHFSRLYQNYIDFQELQYAGIDTTTFNNTAKKDLILEQKNILLQRLQISGDLSFKRKQQFDSEPPYLYSSQLERIIKKFQVRHGLEADGIVGKKTRYWLNISYQTRLRLMALNLLRMQLWTMQHPREIIVNIPNFEMQYWEDEQKIFESKVVVGRLERRTPLFTSRLDSIVFNPDWKVPNSIMRKDILPKVLMNPDYLSRNNFEIIEHWQSDNVIDPKQIDWQLMRADTFPYQLRQKSGKSNILGAYKFNTPNKNAIYLHDTPAKYLFDKHSRAYSSGCIRVQKAQKFAQLLMRKSGFSPADFRFHHEQQVTNSVALKKTISVRTIYQTVWVDAQRTTQFRNDIYHYDAPKNKKHIKN